MILTKAQQKRMDQFESWMDRQHLQTLTDELKNDIIEEVRELIEELKELEG
jgi:hypothetical protein